MFTQSRNLKFNLGKFAGKRFFFCVSKGVAASDGHKLQTNALGFFFFIYCEQEKGTITTFLFLKLR